MPTQKHFQIPENITIKNSKTQNRYGQNRKKKKIWKVIVLKKEIVEKEKRLLSNTDISICLRVECLIE